MQASDAAVGMRVRSSVNTCFKGGYTITRLTPDTCDIRADAVVYTRADGSKMRLKGGDYEHVRYAVLTPESATVA